MKIALCAIAKNEELYIRNWIEWHKNIGIDNIIFCDNEEVNSDKQYNTIIDYINSGYVFYENYRGARQFQNRAYEEMYKKYRSQFDWIGFIDVDEFINFNKVKNIKEYFEQDFILSANMIAVNFKCFGDNGLLYYSNEPVWKRFTEQLPIMQRQPGNTTICINSYVKTFVKCYNDDEITSLTHHHIYKKHQCKIIDAIGNVKYTNNSLSKILWDGMWLNHYITYSAEECTMRRYKRGDAYWGEHGGLTKTFGKNEICDFFFGYNTKTDEKIKIIDDTIRKINNPNNICVATLCYDGCVNYTIALISSFFKNNSDFRGDFIIMYNDEHAKLSQSNISYLSRINDNIKCVHVDFDKYKNIEKIIYDKLYNKGHIACLLKFEMLTMGYSKILYLDSDMIVCDKIIDIFDMDDDIVMVEDFGRGDDKKHIRNDEYVNAGLIYFGNEKYLNKKTQDEIISFGENIDFKRGYKTKTNIICNFELSDQDIINSFFIGKKMILLPYTYNMPFHIAYNVNNVLNKNKWTLTNEKIIHFWTKPNDTLINNYDCCKLWKYYYDLHINTNIQKPYGPPPISVFLGQTNATPNQPKFIQYTPPKNQNREIENNIVKKANENNNAKKTNVRSQLPPRRQMSRALATFLR